MKTNPLVSQRFQELHDKATAIAAAKTPWFFDRNEGEQLFKIDTANFTGWATSVLNLLQRLFGEDSIHFQHFSRNSAGVSESYNGFKRTLSIFDAAREDYEGGYLFNLQSLVKAEVFDDMLEQSRALLKAGYKDPACVVAGVALETTLKDLCSRNGIAHSKLDKMNANLAKVGTYNKGMQKQITAWADRRNSAAHGDWNAYNDHDVDDMINGVIRLIADYI
ncbi:hypothetical protein Poly24_27930 [Rosistilla carotiformis]|uniref:DUF4145 domain-containing protein n=1 Tax=Rosistilla carotiformis TaxID=2528017 RepID=A0A518JU54_9BACT|nr:hypothetical protein [Rosistilla carotiformis]QDV69079.1 hypothetical protein Poly24_27930 [Rosistilla carotiformis]